MTRIHPTAIIDPSAEIGEGTEVGPYVIIEAEVRIGAGNIIAQHCSIARRTTIGDNNRIFAGAVLGEAPQDIKFDPNLDTRTIIGDGNIFREHATVHRATKDGGVTRIGSGGMFMVNSHVAHDCTVGDGVVLVNNASITGHCELGDGVILSGMVGLHQFTRVGRLTLVSALSAANKDLPPFMIFGGRPAVAQGLNSVGLRRNGVGPEARKQLKQAYRWLYREGNPINETAARIAEELDSAECQELAAFIRSSQRGIAFGAAEVEDTLLNRRKSGAARHGQRETEEPS